MGRETQSMAINQDVQTQPTQASVLDNALMLTLDFGRFGVTKKASLGMVEVNSDKALLSLRKRVLKCDEYDAIKSLDRDIRKYIETAAVPFPIRAGAFLIPDVRSVAVDEKLEEFATRRAALVDAFIAVYPSKIIEIENDLRDLYNAKDYPDAEDVRSKFTMAWAFQNYGVPGRLSKISVKLAAQEAEKAKARLQEATAVMQDAMRAEMAQFVEYMNDRMTPTEDGKKKIFKAPAIAKFTEFLDGFADRNLTGDAELAALVADAKNLLNGVDIDQLRKEDGLRSALQVGFSRIKEQMADMITERGRKVFFDAPANVDAESDGDDDDNSDASEVEVSASL